MLKLLRLLRLERLERDCIPIFLIFRKYGIMKKQHQKNIKEKLLLFISLTIILIIKERKTMQQMCIQQLKY